MKIEHKYFPGFVMEVLEEGKCPSGVDAHKAYRIIDPEGEEDWLCEDDVEIVEE